MNEGDQAAREAVLDQIAADTRLAAHLSRKLAQRLNVVAAQLREIDDTFASIDRTFVPIALVANSQTPLGRHLH